MSELIDRQAALDAIKNAEFGREYDEVEKVQIFNPWRRVEDGLPEEEGRYFIAVFYKGKWLYNVAWFVKDIGDILGVPGSDGKGGFVSNSTEVCPDCWMMPIEPPKEDA